MNCATIQTNRRQLVPLAEFLENSPTHANHLLTANFLSVRDECNISSTCKSARERFVMLALLSSDKWAAIDHTACKIDYKIGRLFSSTSLTNLAKYVITGVKISPSNRFLIDEK